MPADVGDMSNNDAVYLGSPMLPHTGYDPDPETGTQRFWRQQLLKSVMPQAQRHGADVEEDSDQPAPAPSDYVTGEKTPGDPDATIRSGVAPWIWGPYRKAIPPGTLDEPATMRQQDWMRYKNEFKQIDPDILQAAIQRQQAIKDLMA